MPKANIMSLFKKPMGPQWLSFALLAALIIASTTAYQNCGTGFGGRNIEIPSQSASGDPDTLQPGDSTSPGKIALSTLWKLAAWEGYAKLNLFFDRPENDIQAPPTLNVEIEQDPAQVIKLENAQFAAFLKQAPQRAIVSQLPQEFDVVLLSDDFKSVLSVKVAQGALALRWQVPLAKSVSAAEFAALKTGSDASGPTIIVGENLLTKVSSSAPVVIQQVAPICSSSQHLENAVCVANQKACPVTNGTGLQTWANSVWGTCDVVSCAAGFTKVGASCSAIQIAMNAGTSSYKSVLKWQSTPAANASVHLNQIVNASLVTEKLADLLTTEPVLVSFNDVDEVVANKPSEAQILAATTGLHRLMSVSFCARYAPVKTDASKCASSAIAYIKKWTAASVPSGNPVADMRYRLLIMAMDLMMPLMTEADVTASKAWMLSVISKNNTYMATLPATDGRFKDGWTSARLLMRAMYDAMAGSATSRANTLKLYKKFIADHFTPPVGWKPSDPTPTPGNTACRNQTSIDEPIYGGLTFRTHDSLRSQAYVFDAINFLHGLVGFTGLTAAETKLIEDAYSVYQPYVKGTKTHLEWKCTQFQYDIDKRVEGDPFHAIVNFEPANHSAPFRVGRLAFPASKAWTEVYVTNQYSPWMRFWFALRGEVGP